MPCLNRVRRLVLQDQTGGGRRLATAGPRGAPGSETAVLRSTGPRSAEGSWQSSWRYSSWGSPGNRVEVGSTDGMIRPLVSSSKAARGVIDTIFQLHGLIERSSMWSSVRAARGSMARRMLGAYEGEAGCVSADKRHTPMVGSGCRPAREIGSACRSASSGRKNDKAIAQVCLSRKPRVQDRVKRVVW